MGWGTRRQPRVRAPVGRGPGAGQTWLRGRLGRWTELAEFCLMVFGVFAILHWWAPLRRYGVRQDEIIVGFIGFLFFAIGLGMLLRTPRWRGRNLGVWGVVVGLSLWFGAEVWLALYQSHDVSRPPPAVAVLGDVIRALFVCGGSLLFGAYVRFWGRGSRHGDDEQARRTTWRG